MPLAKTTLRAALALAASIGALAACDTPVVLLGTQSPPGSDAAPADASPHDAADAADAADAGVDATPDGGACPEDPCRLRAPQCGCGEGEMCTLDVSTRDLGCVPAGTVPPGALCDSTSDCTPGFGCTGRLGSPAGVCRAWCEGNAECDDAPCVALNETPLAATCAPTCDPVFDQGCPGGLHCHLAVFVDVTGRSVGYTQCAPSGSVGLGGFCQSRVDCVTGTDCVSSRCLRVCRLTDGAGCASGQVCARRTTDFVIEGVNHGACVNPS